MSPLPIFPRQGEPVRACRPTKVIFIGAGLAGVHFAKLVRQHGVGIQLRIYERHADLGGTWYSNRYPGLGCDIPSHAYTFSWAPWHGWQRFLAPGADCLRYVNRCAELAGLREYACFSTNVVSAVWDEGDAVWKVELEDIKTGRRFTDEARVLVNGSGVMNRINTPKIEGLDLFRGAQVHSAAWDERVDLNDKCVAIVGSGSSALQMVPVLQQQAKHLDLYMRSPTWIAPAFGEDERTAFFGSSHAQVNPAYTDEQQAEFAANPAKLRAHRKELCKEMNNIFTSGFTERSWPLRETRRNMLLAMAEQALARKPELLEAFQPTWAPGCRRITPAPGLFEALVEPNVDVVRTEVVRMTETGLVGADGMHREYDTVILATGFETDFKPTFEVRGRGGARVFESGLRAYLIAHYEDMPNYFSTSGPNLAIGNGDYLGVLEKVAEHIFKFVVKLQRDRYRWVCVKTENVRDFTAWVDEYMERTVHTEECASWYKGGRDGHGRVRGVWPGTVAHVMEALANPRWEDFEWHAEPGEGARRFDWLGNGRATLELHDGDLAWYLDEAEVADGPVPRCDPAKPPIHLPF